VPTAPSGAHRHPALASARLLRGHPYPIRPRLGAPTGRPTARYHPTQHALRTLAIAAQYYKKALTVTFKIVLGGRQVALVGAVIFY